MVSRTAAIAAQEDGLLSQWAFRNKLINGNFDFWQRGVSFSGPGYGPDRWRIDSATNVVLSRGSASAPYGKYSLLLTPNAASNQLGIAQCLEDSVAIPLAGKKATFSFQVNSSASQNLVLTAYIQVSSTANSAAGGGTWNIIAQKTVSVGTTPQAFQLSADIPSGGAANGIRVAFAIQNAAKDAGIGIWGCQFEEGAVATPFEFRPAQIELALCQRYYEKSYNPDFAPGSPGAQGAHVGKIVDGTTIAAPTVYYKATKRVPPTVVFYSMNTGAAGRSSCNGTDVPGPSGGAYGSGCSAFELYWGSNQLATSEKNVYQHWASDAEL